LLNKKDNLPKFFPASNTGVKHLPKFSFEITNSPKFFPTRILHYMVYSPQQQIMEMYYCETICYINYLPATQDDLNNTKNIKIISKRVKFINMHIHIIISGASQ